VVARVQQRTIDEGMTLNDWQGNNVRLRAVEPEDIDFFCACHQDSDRCRRLDHVSVPPSRAMLAAWVEKQSRRDFDSETFFWVIENEVAERVGGISTHLCQPRTGTFGYALDIVPAHRRKGYAGEAIRLVLRFYFDELRYQKVTVSVHSDNEASIRLHERLGFQHEGRLRRMVFTNGVFLDEIWLGMTVEEFHAQQWTS
jgi:RimJ/RimL family protein N-acetyltransferase